MAFPNFFERGEVVLNGIEVGSRQRQEEPRGPGRVEESLGEGAHLVALGLGIVLMHLTFHPREGLLARAQLPL